MHPRLKSCPRCYRRRLVIVDASVVRLAEVFIDTHYACGRCGWHGRVFTEGVPA